MTEISLPELPPPALVNTQVPQCWFTTDQMMKFARDAVRIERLTSLPSAPAASEEDGLGPLDYDREAIIRMLEDYDARPFGAAYKTSLVREQIDKLRHAANTSKRAAGEVVAWIVGNAEGDCWCFWGESGPEWTADRNAALHFARRDDAETFSRDNEDAWRIQPVHPPRHPADEGNPT